MPRMMQMPVAHCEIAADPARLAVRLSLGPSIRAAIVQLMVRWDGKMMPGEAPRGEAIQVPARGLCTWSFPVIRGAPQSGASGEAPESGIGSIEAGLSTITRPIHRLMSPRTSPSPTTENHPRLGQPGGSQLGVRD
jgi:hypothetical protein